MIQVHIYTNPWFDTLYAYPYKDFRTTAHPIKYNGFQIFERILGTACDDICDIVVNGTCISQHITVALCKQWIDDNGLTYMLTNE